MNRKNLIAAILATASTLAALPALADTKAGVDAWTRGDYAAAVREWQAEAAKGDADAMFNLGQAYKLGRGVPQDLAKAEALYAQASALGHLQASDNYGLLLFQRGERKLALPYLRAASDRGDPRAQYLLGIAHFNGDLLPKDWVRAYALITLANQQGLPQARDALTQMDSYIPIEQRQQGVALAAELDSEAQATRARQMAAVDLGTTVPGANPPVTARTKPPKPQPMPTAASASDAVAEAERTAAGSSPRTAGADYARPVAATTTVAASPAPKPAPKPAAAASVPAATGNWRIQLGAFGQASNADALWAKVKGRPELSGHPRLNVKAGAVTKLQAGGFASREAAQAACARLSSAGFTCVPVAP